MREISLNEYKDKILAVLVKVDSICREHGLKYCLCMGEHCLEL
jgi:phosphorylcholine metabolism protein LicD